MKVMILGCNGYLGRATWEYLEARGHQVLGVDNDRKQDWLAECGVRQLMEPNYRGDYWDKNAQRLGSYWYDEGVTGIIHYAEQASAPYSMLSEYTGRETLLNNLLTTHALVQSVRRAGRPVPIVKLGTLGEYGQPGVHIPEGYYVHHERTDGVTTRTARLLFPKMPGSLYHTTKVMDSDMLDFACRIGWLPGGVTDLHQGVVYGCSTDELPETTFYYDAIFGTALNRFVAQAVAGVPLTVYGKGGQTRGWLNILDTLRCVELALLNPPQAGEFRVLNQFTEVFSVLELAERVRDVAQAMDWPDTKIAHIDNPRRELEEHYYSVSNDGFKRLGLEPHLLTDDIISGMLARVAVHRHNIDTKCILPGVRW